MQKENLSVPRWVLFSLLRWSYFTVFYRGNLRGILPLYNAGLFSSTCWESVQSKQQSGHRRKGWKTTRFPLQHAQTQTPDELRTCRKENVVVSSKWTEKVTFFLQRLAATATINKWGKAALWRYWLCVCGGETRQLILLALEKTAVLQKHVGKNNASWMACGAETRTRFCCAKKKKRTSWQMVPRKLEEEKTTKEKTLNMKPRPVLCHFVGKQTIGKWFSRSWQRQLQKQVNGKRTQHRIEKKRGDDHTDRLKL